MPNLAYLEGSETAMHSADDFFTSEQAHTLFEKAAEKFLHISGDEFLKRWNAGYYEKSEENTRATRVAMLIPMVRETSVESKSI